MKKHEKVTKSKSGVFLMLLVMTWEAASASNGSEPTVEKSTLKYWWLLCRAACGVRFACALEFAHLDMRSQIPEESRWKNRQWTDQWVLLRCLQHLF